MTVTDDSIPVSDLFVLAVNDTKNPSIVAYCINNGNTNFLKIDKNMFKILEIRVGDVITAKSYEKRPEIKIMGKTKAGFNILGDDDSKNNWWLTGYEIKDRDYKKNNTLIIDTEFIIE